MDNKPPHTDAAKSLFRAGRFADVLRTSLPFIDKRVLSVEHRLIVARAMLHVNHTEAARRIAEAANEPHAKPLLRSRCELILGIAAKRGGDLTTARRRMQQAIHLAREAGHTKQEAWAQVSLFRVLAEGEPQELISAVLTHTRRLATRAADPHLTAYLHDSVSVLETQTGRLDEARRHLDVAISIIERYPNAWLEQVVHNSKICLACIECDPVTAAKHARKVRQLSDLTGGYPADTLDINEAYINLFTGKFARAHAPLQRVVQNGAGFPKLVAAEALARLYLTLNRLDDCEAALDLIDGASDANVANCYAARWTAAIRARLLMRRALPALAVDCVRRERARARAVGDQPLVATLTFLEAAAHAQNGDLASANTKMFESGLSGATVFREYLGHYFEAYARVLAAEESELAPLVRARAIRVWRAEGNIQALVEATSHPGSALPIQDVNSQPLDRHTASENIHIHSDSKVAYVLDAVAAALDLSFDSRLACTELMNIAASAGCARIFQVVERSGTTASRLPRRHDKYPGTIITFADSSRVELHCKLIEGLAPSLPVNSILRIARAVETVAKARVEERNRTALWPADVFRDEESLFISDEMTSLVATARKVATTTVPVLITGETGTGKEILARAIHVASTRAKATLLPFNCSSGPRDMIDAQLFGHRRGAFTGATENAPGIVRAAAGGTLFLDEIGEAPLDLQPKLLRFLESGEVHPVGEPHPTKVDVRIIAATNVDLDAAVSSGRFREDLFYRLNIVRLHLPALRERRVEIPVFAQHFLRKHAREFGKGNLRLAEETMEYLLLYKWPGNVRQLANEMRRMAALAETDAVLMPEHLSSDIVASRRTVPASERMLDANELVVRLDQPLAAATEHLERTMIPYVLKQCAGRVEEAAQKLGISRKGLYLKRLRLGLETPDAHVRPA